MFLEAMNNFSRALPYSPSFSSLSSSPSFPQLQSLQHAQSACLCRHRTQAGTVPSGYRREGAYGDADSGRWGVDEDMIVLRKRLHEMEVAERNYEPPSQWMAWEKRYHHRYDADVCRLVGLLQAFLLSTRPGVALGLLTLVALSVPTSTAVVVLNAICTLKAVLANIHLA